METLKYGSFNARQLVLKNILYGQFHLSRTPLSRLTEILNDPRRIKMAADDVPLSEIDDDLQLFQRITTKGFIFYVEGDISHSNIHFSENDWTQYKSLEKKYAGF